MQIEINDPKFLPHAGLRINFELPQGKWLAIAGENGVGKSSLARAVFKKMWGQKASYIDQAPLEHFYDRTLDTFKKIILDVRHSTFEPERFNAIWNDFGLSLKENRSLKQLSGGENQALKLTMGLCQECETIILDEPSQYLDQTRKDVLKKWLLHLEREGKTILVIEHDLSWLPSGTKVILLENREGMIQEGKVWTT